MHLVCPQDLQTQVQHHPLVVGQLVLLWVVRSSSLIFCGCIIGVVVVVVSCGMASGRILFCMDDIGDEVDDIPK